MRPQVIARALGLLLLALPVTAFAQDPGLGPDPDAPANAAPPITVVYVEGRVDTARAGGGVQPTRVADLLDDDDRVVTADGRAELAYDDGSVLHLDRGTDARVDAGGRLRLVRGRIAIHTPRDADPLELAIPVGVLHMEPDGEYDVTASDLDGDTVMTAVRGRAALDDDDRSLPISADDELRLAPRDREPRWARAAAPDAFRQWANARIATTMRIAREHDLPPSLAPYGPQFSQYGQWTTMAPYGSVWMPSAPAGWRPYTNGSWRYTRYGWTWIDSDPWGWPVHHYGRWGRHDTRGWYWIPQRTWAPAWVGWAIAADHVAWSPLGWDRRPLVDFFVGARGGPIDAWATSWSILPRQSFGTRGPVFRQLEDPRRLPGPVLGGFVSQMVGPRGPAGAGDRYAPRPGRGSFTRPETPVRERQWSAPTRREPPRAFDTATPSRGIDEGEPRRDDGERSRRPGDAPPAAPRPGDARPRDARPRDHQSIGQYPGSAGRAARPGDARRDDGAPAAAAPTYRGRPNDGVRPAEAARPRREPQSEPSSTSAPAEGSTSAPTPRGPTGGSGGVIMREGPRRRPAGEGSSGAAPRGVTRHEGSAAGAPATTSGSSDGNRRRPR